MPFLVNFFAMSRRRVVMLGTGLASLFQVVSIALAGVFGSRGTAKERITAALTTPRSQRWRSTRCVNFLPNMVLEAAHHLLREQGHRDHWSLAGALAF